MAKKQAITILFILFISNFVASAFSIRPTAQGDSIIVANGEKVLGLHAYGETVVINSQGVKYKFILDSVSVEKYSSLGEMKIVDFYKAATDTTIVAQQDTTTTVAPQPRASSVAKNDTTAVASDTIAPAPAGYSESQMALTNLRRDVIQGYKMKGQDVYLKSANATGFGIEVYAGPSIIESNLTFNAGAGFRYDLPKWTFRLDGYATQRKYNDEAETAGNSYFSYGANFAIHYNLWAQREHVHVLSLYAEGGYLFGKHNYQVGEAEVTEGTNVKRVRHNGSGLTYGGGLEYRRSIWATGNSWFARAGVSVVPNVYVNDTALALQSYFTVGFNFGVNRNRK